MILKVKNLFDSWVCSIIQTQGVILNFHKKQTWELQNGTITSSQSEIQSAISLHKPKKMVISAN
jgi:hypothetical protein